MHTPMFVALLVLVSLHTLFLLSFTPTPSLALPSSLQQNHLQLLHKRSTIRCFSQPPPPTIPLHKATISDCIDAALYISEGDKAHAPMDFSRTSGFEIPHAWKFGTCVILMDALFPTAEDTFPLVEVSIRALKIVEECLGNNVAELGGMEVIGPKQAMSVVVKGRVAPPVDPPPLYFTTIYQQMMSTNQLGSPTATARPPQAGGNSPNSSVYGDPETPPSSDVEDETPQRTWTEEEDDAWLEKLIEMAEADEIIY